MVDLGRRLGRGPPARHSTTSRRPPRTASLLRRGGLRHWPDTATVRRVGRGPAARQAARGAQGLEDLEAVGLHVRVPWSWSRWTTRGSTRCGRGRELRLPVLIHVADPVAFFDPLDAANERWEELQAHPDWQFTQPAQHLRHPDFPSIVEALARLASLLPPPGDHVYRRARRLLRREPGPGWARVLDALPQLLRSTSRPPGRAGPPALHRAPLLPRATPTASSSAPTWPPDLANVPPLLPLPRNRRRILPLRPRATHPAPGPLADLRPRPAR